MSIRHIIIYISFAVIAGGVLFWALFHRPDTPEKKAPLQASFENKKDQIPFKTSAHLYFADKAQPFLTAEKRDLMYRGDSISFAKAIMEALIQGPKNNLVPILPAETALRALYIDRDKTAYVDMAASLPEHLPGGIQRELFTIYAIVNSLVLNISAIDTVKILIEGREALTLSGHVDLRFPFKANMLLVR